MGLVLRYLTIRDRTEHEAQAFLRKKGYEQAAIQDTIAKLRQWGYLDDTRVALAWARDRLEQVHWGPARLSGELGRRGVEDQVIERVLEEIMADTSEEKLAWEAAQRYLRTHPRTQGPKGMRRLAAFLGRRGYSGAVIGRIIQERLGE